MPTKAWEDFNNQVDGYQSALSPATLSSPNELIDKVGLMAEMEVRHGPRNTDFCWLSMNTAESQSVSSTDQHQVPDMAQFTGLPIQPPGGRLITVNYFHHRKAVFSFYYNRWLIWMCFFFFPPPARSASDNATTHELKNNNNNNLAVLKRDRKGKDHMEKMENPTRRWRQRLWWCGPK